MGYDNYYLNPPKDPDEGPGLIGMIVMGIGALIYLIGVIVVYFIVGLLAATLLFRLTSGGSHGDD